MLNRLAPSRAERTPAPLRPPGEAALHVVAYTDTPARGGAEVALRSLIAAFGDGIRVTVMGVEPAVLEWIASSRPGTPVVVLPRIKGKTDLRGMWQHRRAVARLRPDVFHANLVSMWSCQYAIFAALTVPGVRVVAVEHTHVVPESRLTLLLKRFTEGRLAGHAAVSETTARQVESIAGLKPGAIRVIPVGVADTDNGPPPERFPRPVVGTVSRVDALKRLDLLVTSLVDLPDVHAVVVGEGDETENIRALAARLGVADRLHLVGWSDQPRSYLGAFDVFALPSDLESAPLSVVEAMLAGLPVVTTRVGRLPELIEDGVTGWTVPPGDQAAFTAALADVLRDPERRLRMGQAARERARREPTTADTARTFEAMYRAATPRRSRRRARPARRTPA